MGQLVLAKNVEKEPQAILRQAAAFFGSEGVGLTLVRQDAESLHLTGGGGHVEVRAVPSDDDQTEVEVETRDWEYDVKRFMKSL